jgi:hypothetical protein
MPFIRALKLVIAIRERKKSALAEQILILGTALMDGDKRQELINEISEESELDSIIGTDFKALDKIKSQMK